MFKKILCVLSALTIALAVASCGGEETTTDIVKTTVARTTVTSKNSVKELAEKGTMDCTTIKLGDIVDRIYEKYPKRPSGTASNTNANQNDDGIYLEEKLGTTMTRFMYSDLQFYTVNGRDNEGVAIIVTGGNAYGFKCGVHLKSDVVASLGTPDFEGKLAEKERFFMFGGQNVERLAYKFGKYRLDFIITDGTLSQMVLFDTALYTGVSDK